MDEARTFLRDGILLWVRKGRSASVTVNLLLRSLFPRFLTLFRDARGRLAGEGARDRLALPPITPDHLEARASAESSIIHPAEGESEPSLAAAFQQLEELREELHPLTTTIRSVQRVVAAEHPQYFLGPRLSLGSVGYL